MKALHTFLKSRSSKVSCSASSVLDFSNACSAKVKPPKNDSNIVCPKNAVVHTFLELLLKKPVQAFEIVFSAAAGLVLDMPGFP
jgi:hypothetical protein